MTYSCCCNPETPMTPDRYSKSCFCEKCMPRRSYYMCLKGITANNIPPISSGPAAGVPPCRSFTELAEHLIELRGTDGSHYGARNHWCNCAYMGLGHIGTDSCLSGNLVAWLELEELCTQRDPNSIGYIKRGLREDFHCFEFNVRSSNRWYDTGGVPCSPCYSNSGNIRGSISGATPFSMECGNEYEQYVNVSPACPAGSNVSASGDFGVDGDIDECDDLADRLDGKYFWITDDVGDKFHVWLQKSTVIYGDDQNVDPHNRVSITVSDVPDPDPAGSSGVIRVRLLYQYLHPDDLDTYGIDAPRRWRSVNNCGELKHVIDEAIGQVEERDPDARSFALPGHDYPRKWRTSPTSALYEPTFSLLCNPLSISWPDNICTFCVTANKTFRQDGNQAVTIYDGNSGFEFGDGGADDMVGGMGNCCSGPTPRLFIEVPTLKEEVDVWYHEYTGRSDPPSLLKMETVNIGGTSHSDCVAGDPLCVCDNARGEEGANPGDPPVITDYGTSNHALYEYGLSGDFDCYDCNTFTLRSKTEASNSDTSHITLPNEITVCPTAPCKKEKVGFLIVIDSDSQYGCPDSNMGGSWNTGSCFFDADAANLSRFIAENPDVEVRIQVVKAKGSENREIPPWTGVVSHPDWWNCSGWNCLWSQGWWHAQRAGYTPWEHCGCLGVPVGIAGITGGSAAIGGLPIGITEVDNCSEVSKDPDMYGWNKDACCRPAGPQVPHPVPFCDMGTGGQGTQGARACPREYLQGYFHWGFPPGGPACSCCCDHALNMKPGALPGPAHPHPPPIHITDPRVLYEDKCSDLFPKERNRSGGTFEAGCSRISSNDIYNAWSALTSGGSWIPNDLYFWWDEQVAEGNGIVSGPGTNPLMGSTTYVENQDQWICDNPNASGGWRRALRWLFPADPDPCTGISYDHIAVNNLAEEWTDAYLMILDDVLASGADGPRQDCLGNNYERRPISAYNDWRRLGNNLMSYNAPDRWLKQVVEAVRPLGCNFEPVAADCPDRYVYAVSTLDLSGSPSQFFDCPPQVGSPCWGVINVGSARDGWRDVWAGLKKYSSDTAGCARTKNRCGNGWIWNTLYDWTLGWGGGGGGNLRGRPQYRMGFHNTRILNHPINNGWSIYGFGESGYRVNHCPCSNCNCDAPFTNANFTINSSSNCWSINNLNGEPTESALPLGGAFTLSPIDGSCEWGAEFSNSFITEATLIKRPHPGWRWSGGAQIVLSLYHRGKTVATYSVIGENMSDYCSGSITLDRQDVTWTDPRTGITHRTGHRELHANHICDPCSFDAKNYSRALFNLHQGMYLGANVINGFHDGTITLTSEDGTTRTYTLKTDGSADPNLLEFNWDTGGFQLPPMGGGVGQPWVNTFRNFKAVVESPSGHNGKIEVYLENEIDPMSGRWTSRYMKLQQNVLGGGGDTDIIYSPEFNKWCQQPVNNSTLRGVIPCPSKFEGGEWCMTMDVTSIPHRLVPGCRGFSTHPNSWPHSCPCQDLSIDCLPDTITVTI